METLVVYSVRNSNRLKYTLDWLLKERLQLAYRITTDENEIKGLPFFISYGIAFPNSLSVPDSGLLWKDDIHKHDPLTGKWKEIPTIFPVDIGDETSLPFDLFSAVFYLLSRYEEYYPFTPDKHGRYPATSSILYRKGWLQRPLVDEWILALRNQLSAGGIQLPQALFLYQPTYDIDMAYSHLHKGVGRIVGAYMRALLKGDVKQISERTQVLKNKQKDPYDSFRWLRQLHKEYDCKPVYFILSAFKTTAFDKNIHPQHPAMMRVIKNLAKEGTIGIHPSYYSAQDDIMSKEKTMLEHISSRKTHISRQHYIKIKTPDTWRLLLKNEITEDYSMGYGAHLGFRAGTGSSFLWYDLEKETATSLRVHPFCFMDTTAHFEGKLSVAEAFDKLNEMSTKLEQTGSTLITIFHNFSLGTGNEWKGWRQAYESFLQEKTRVAQSLHDAIAPI